MNIKQKRFWRNTLVTKALLLGYQIQKAPPLTKRVFVVILPNGQVMKTDVVQYGRINKWPNIKAFPAPWLAAFACLQHAGVIPDWEKPH